MAPIGNNRLFTVDKKTATCRYSIGHSVSRLRVLVDTDTSTIQLPVTYQGGHKLRPSAWEKLLIVLRSVTRAWKSKMLVFGPQASLCSQGVLILSPSSYGVAGTLRKDCLKDAAVWRAYHRLKLPHGDLESICTSLWKKLAVGKRRHQFFPRIPHTHPLCGGVENVYHRTKPCTWLMTPMRVFNNIFPAV